MKPQDSLFLSLLAAALFVSVVTFFYQRRLGRSVAVSTWIGGIFFGLSLSIEVFFFYNSLFQRRGGTGLDIFIVPPLIFLVISILSGFVALCVFVFSHFRAPESATSLSASAQSVLKRATRQRAFHRGPTTDWREFARESQSATKGL